MSNHAAAPKIPAWIQSSCLVKLRSPLFANVRRVRTRRGLLNIGMDEGFRMARSNPQAEFLEFGVFKGVDLEFLSKALSKRCAASGVAPPLLFHGFDAVFLKLQKHWLLHKDFTCCSAQGADLNLR